MPSSSSKNPQIYVSRLPRKATSDDLKDLFKKYGKIREILLKNGYAFIEFDDYRDADEAANEMDGKSFEGQKIIVQPAGQKKTPSRRDARGPQAADKCYNCGKPGHWANECREEGYRGNNNSAADKNEKKCYNCGETGHIKRFCPKLRSRSRSRGKSYSRSRSRSSRSSRSKSRSRSRSSHSRSRDKKRKHSKRNKSRSRSRSKDRKNHKSRSRSASKNGNPKGKSRSGSRSKERSKSKSQ